ncbi:MAG TPA: tetratricopeptide repeat protein, partial [bacterium]|nr:tetratricopeptide repeat protein [bacterium]
KQIDSAIKLYQRIIREIGRRQSDQLLSHIINNSYLKLGLLYYEQGDPEKSIVYLNQVDSNYEYYDLSLMGKAWSAFQAGRPGEALFNVEGLLNRRMVSSYAYEARVLAATSKELMGLDEEAIKDLKNVFRAKDRFIQWPTGSARKQTDEETLREQTEEFNQWDVLDEMKSIRLFLNQSILRKKRPTMVRNQSDNVKGVAEVLDKKIRDLDKLEQEARRIGDRTLLEEIRQLRGNLLKSLEAHTDDMASLGADSGKDPLVEKMGLMTYLKYGFQTLLQQILTEKDQTMQGIQLTEQNRRQAREKDDFALMIELEIQREELEDYYGKLNQYEVWLRENFPEELNVELDRWASLSGYGISSINYNNIKQVEANIARISQTIDVFDRLFYAKRSNLESQIQDLLSDVEQIEYQMKEELEKEESLERDRFLKTNYFDRHQKESKVGPLKIKEKTGGEEEKR